MSGSFNICSNVWLLWGFLWRWGLVVIELTPPKSERIDSVSVCRSGREDNLWKQTAAKVQRSAFPGPWVRCGLPAPCRERLFVCWTSVFSKALPEQSKMNCNFLREAATSLTEDEWKKKSQLQQQKSQNPPHPSQETHRSWLQATDQARNMLAFCQSVKPF